MVKEFYANMVGMKDKTIYVRNKWISFNREEIEKNLQSEQEEEWFKVQETSKRTRLLENC